MANIARLTSHMTPRSFGHDIPIPIGSRSLKRALVAGLCAAALVSFVAMTSGCSSATTGGDASGVGGNSGSDASGAGGNPGSDDAGGGDGPILTACPAVEPAMGTPCAESLNICAYGQQPCCNHFEPVSAAACELGRIRIRPWETACVLGLVCPADGGASDAADGMDGGSSADAQADGASSSGG
jgi:hypothetical protein